MMKAMILSAGYGKRLNPLTLDYPKPLLKIGSETLLSNTLKFLEQYGIEQVVINVYYLGEKIEEYLDKRKFNLAITIVKEKDKILDTGGGVLNAIQHFSKDPFLIINPDTIWNKNYIVKLKSMENFFLTNSKTKCLMLVVDKLRSFDKSLKGDFNLDKNLITRSDKKNLKYIFTGLQIIKPQIFYNIKEQIFSMNKIWDNLILNNELNGIESDIDFFHVSTLNIYKNLLEKF